MLNSHKLFFHVVGREGFLAELDVPEDEKQELASARDIIRAEIRVGFLSWSRMLDRRTILSEAALRKSVADPTLRPKFRMQGSASYHTLNDPAWHPPQQIDYDDGVYLPISFLAENGDPVLASAGYFRLVETILEPLCKRKGWKLRTDKPSCVRVQLHAKAHIDLPLYAIPDNQFETLIETTAALKSFSERQRIRDGVELADSLYEAFPEDEIRLAHREQGWIKSDPRLIERWFRDAVDTHGPQLRRVCRYYKGWRDYQWKGCCLTSLTVMKCVVDAFDALKSSLNENRDDLAVLTVASRLDGYFRGDIYNPVFDAVLNDNWSDDDRTALRAAAQELHERVETAVKGTDNRGVALSELTAAFGPRIPQDASLIVLTAEAAVKSFQATKMPAPNVPRTTSG